MRNFATSQNVGYNRKRLAKRGSTPAEIKAWQNSGILCKIGGAARPPCPTSPLRFEPLEDRRVLAALVVNSPLDNTIAADGLVTLREAILAANNDTTTDFGHTGSGADEITFDFGHDGPETITLTAGQLVINSDLVITGASRDLLTIDAAGNDTLPDVDNGSGSRVFDILPGRASGWNVTLSGVALTGGDVSGRGGAIQSAGFLILDDVMMFGNAAGDDGGAVYATQRLAILNTDILDNATGGSGGAIYADRALSVGLVDSEIIGNTASVSGGALFIDNSSLSIDGGRINGNRVGQVNSGFRGGGVYVRDTSMQATGVVISSNHAAEGGGVFALRSLLTFESCQIDGNQALAGNGGGINIEMPTGIDPTPGGVTLNATTMSGNTSSQNGGAIFSRNSFVAINDSLIAHNVAAQVGGGVSIHRNGLRVVRSRITGNVAGSNGGGLAADSNLAFAPATLYIADSSIDGNEADGSGGGVYANRIFDPTITRSTLHTNTANLGGGVAVRGETSLSVINSTISGNHAVTSGGGISAHDSSVSLAHSTVTGNSAASNPDGTGAGGGIIAYGDTQIGLGHTIVAGNSERFPFGPDVLLFPRPGFGSPTFTASYSLIGDNRATGRPEAPVGSPDAAGNLVGDVNGQGVIDPKLSPLAYHGGQEYLDGSRILTHALLPGSPAIDAGNPGTTQGQDGEPMYDQRGEPFERVVDGDGMDGARIDMGALERQPNPLAGDYNFSGVVDAADFVVWRKNVGSTTDLQADGDGDGDIDQDDYNVWRASFGRVYVDEPAAATSASTVDEGVLQGGAAIGTAGQVRHRGSSTSRDTGASATIAYDGRPASGMVSTAGEIDYGGTSTSSGSLTLPDDLDLLDWLRTAGVTSSNESEDGLPDVSGDERQDSDDGCRELIELVFAGLGQFNGESLS
jgi:hypothetical protein